MRESEMRPSFKVNGPGGHFRNAKAATERISKKRALHQRPLSNRLETRNERCDHSPPTFSLFERTAQPQWPGVAEGFGAQRLQKTEVPPARLLPGAGDVLRATALQGTSAAPRQCCLRTSGHPGMGCLGHTPKRDNLRLVRHVRRRFIGVHHEGARRTRDLA